MASLDLAKAPANIRDSSAYSLFGAKLIERGYCAVPAFPGTKVPGMIVAGAWRRMSDWTRRYRDRLPADREVETWERAADGGICLIMGKASRGVVAVDIDTDEAVAPVTDALPYTPVKKRGAKGETLFFRNPNNVVSRAFTLIHPDGRRQRLVDMLSEGRQTVLPPSTHPDIGQPYTWTGERELADVDPEDLPDLPADALERIASALAPLGYSPDRDRAPIAGKAASSDDEKSWFRRLNEHALANLDAWVPRLPLCRLRRTATGYEAVADWRASNTGRPLDRRKLNLKLSPSGIVDFGDGPKGYTAINLVQECGVAHGDAAFGWLANATGFGTSVAINLNCSLSEAETGDDETTPRSRATVIESGAVADAETGEVIEELKGDDANVSDSSCRPNATSHGVTAGASIPPANIPPWKAPIDQTHCPGLVGRIADWIVATAEYQQPLLAIGAALTIVGTVAGRQLAGPTNSATHLYILGVAPTGTGKDRPLKAVRRLLFAVGSNLMGPGRFNSDSSIVTELTGSPVVGCAIDEFGAFMARMKSRNASTHEQGITGVLREVWSNNFEPFVSAARASQRSTTLHNLGMSIFGTSTAAELYGALSNADVASGLLNRFLVLNGDPHPTENDTPLNSTDIPDDLVDGLKAIYWRLGELGAAPYHGQGDTQPPPPRVVPWRDAGAERTWKDFRAKVQLAARSGDQLSSDLLVRAAEMAVRIATIRAIGIDPVSPSITQSDVEWAVALVERSTQMLIEGARDNIAESERERRANRIIEAIKKACRSNGHCSRRDISRGVGKAIPNREIEDILAYLVEAERIQKVDVTDGRSDTRRKIAFQLIDD